MLANAVQHALTVLIFNGHANKLARFGYTFLVPAVVGFFLTVRQFGIDDAT
jgi:hypothetical protein